MTADEIMPVFINATQSLLTTLGNAEVFTGITMLEVMIGFMALGILGKFIIWLRTRGGNSEGGNF